MTKKSAFLSRERRTVLRWQDPVLPVTSAAPLTFISNMQRVALDPALQVVGSEVVRDLIRMDHIDPLMRDQQRIGAWVESLS